MECIHISAWANARGSTVSRSAGWVVEPMSWRVSRWTAFSKSLRADPANDSSLRFDKKKETGHSSGLFDFDSYGLKRLRFKPVELRPIRRRHRQRAAACHIGPRS